MAHHKRKRPKSRRAGCLMCKPWKHEREKGGKRAPRISVQRKMQGGTMCE